MLQRYGVLPPVAASVEAYAVPAMACGKVVVEIAREGAVSVLEAAIVTVTASDS